MSASSLPQVFDITFIGAGPTGLFGAFYAGLREMTVKVIDVLPQAGGQLTALYPEKIIYDSPGLPAIASKELVVNLVRQMGRWHPTLALGERAAHLQRIPLPGGTAEETCWRIETDRAEHFSRTVVIAAGIGAFEPITLPNESVQRFVGHGVQYMVQDLEAFGGRRVLIIGGGDSAVDWALAIRPKAHSVTLIHRREGFRAHDASVDALQTSGVDVRVFDELRRLEGEARPERAVIYDNRTQEEFDFSGGRCHPGARLQGRSRAAARMGIGDYWPALRQSQRQDGNQSAGGVCGWGYRVAGGGGTH